ncbi:citrate synthase [Gordonia rhizosphera]|uniref:citrate synthase (unknown stereospecificity) n=1 Tax=Gordonia rhizosphera NBRC 16068 TaxID=1108045 RepID=K6W4L8_9ACTN|nr:citrate synthase [Gordonia rhizosphera]GAB88656.1 putative citrate synthase [Gordonia rhizosphera NBRC 16068]
MSRTHTRRFPKPIRHDGRDYLTSEQVARLLGVKVTTVYAYVSRGRITSVRIDGVDGSVFAVDEVEALASGRSRRAPAGVVERIHTRLTLLEDDHLYYRGHDAVDLAHGTPYEELAALLWDVETDWPTGCLDDDLRRSMPALAGPRARGLDLIRLTVDALGARDPLRHLLERPAVAAKAATTISACVDALGGEGTGSIAARMWPCLTDEVSSARKVALLNAALVLLADHDLSASAVAARVAASARGSIYAVLGAGLGAFDGPVHGGATTLAFRFLSRALDDPEGAVAQQLHAGDPIPGTGHVVYRHRDPRADALLDMLGRTGGGDRRVLPAVDAILRLLPESSFANSDFALAAVAVKYRMRPDAAETMFALSRMAGWTAHAMEEYGERRLRFRPEGVYTGARPGAR